MRRPRHVALAAAAALLGLPAGASAAEPVLPLADVHEGLRCTASTVLHGTDIATFDVDVLDIVLGAGDAPRVLVRVSGPAVDATGVAQGFSGSPVRCPGPDGTPAIIGAISEGTGDFGNKLVLVTPIASMLAETADVPGPVAGHASAVAVPGAAAGARAAAAPRLPVGVAVAPTSAAARARLAATLRGARHVVGRPLATPLSFGGVTGPVAAALRAAGDHLGRALVAAPAVPATTFPPQPLVPGASVAVGLAGGDIAAGAVGTVTYADGDRVWAFGHPLDAAGRRSLLLQDAWVHAVIGSPLVSSDQTPYKLAAPLHDLGTLTNDAPDAVVGRLGTLPDRIPLHIGSVDDDSGAVHALDVEVADETPIGLPTGVSALQQVGPVAVAQAAYDTLRGSPANQSGSMCVRITLRGRKAPLGFCNDYVGGSPDSPGGPMAGDLQAALALLDAYKAATLHVARVDVRLHLRRELRQAWLLRGRATSLGRRGGTVRVRLSGRVVRGPALTRTVRVKVPAGLRTGERELVLSGPGADAEAGGDTLAGIIELSFSDSGAGQEDPGPRTLEQLAAAVAALHRENGVTAAFEGRAAQASVALRDARLRITGTVRVPVTVVGR